MFCVSNSAAVTQIGIDADEERNMSRQSRLAVVLAYPANDNFMIEFAAKVKQTRAEKLSPQMKFSFSSVATKLNFTFHASTKL